MMMCDKQYTYDTCHSFIEQRERINSGKIEWKHFFIENTQSGSETLAILHVAPQHVFVFSVDNGLGILYRQGPVPDGYSGYSAEHSGSFQSIRNFEQVPKCLGMTLEQYESKVETVKKIYLPTEKDLGRPVRNIETGTCGLLTTIYPRNTNKTNLYSIGTEGLSLHQLQFIDGGNNE
jgi:hypothetical protein